MLISIIILCLLSVITFILFGNDKKRAIEHRRRIPERTLLGFSLFGGIGGLLGMRIFRHKTRKWKFRILVPLFAFIDASVLAFLLWASVYYTADASCAAAMRSDPAVTVEKTDTGWLFDGPSEERALIFYPGAKVEETAYAPVLRRLAEEEMDVYLVKMPMHLAIFGMGRAGTIIEHSGYAQYYIGGHSLGGAMAADYAAGHEGDFAGIVLFAAYPVKSTGLDTLLLYGSEDGVLNMDRVKDAPELVSGRYQEIMIEGGNHAQFGNYGKQRGDGPAAISGEEQQEQVVQAVRDFISA